jgi:arsenite methyltransferase
MAKGVIPFQFNNQQFADYYDELPLWSAPFGQLLLEHIPLQPDMSVLDVACGTGFPLLELAGRLGDDAHVVGLDIWLRALTRAKQKRDLFDRQNVSIVGYQGSGFPFADKTFDMVTSNLGVNNFTNPSAAVQECHRVTHSGGFLALTTNVQGHMGEFYTVFRDVLRDFGNPDYIKKLNHQEAHRGDIHTLYDLLETNGYEIQDAHSRHFVMRYANGTAMLQHPFIRFAFLPTWVNLIEVEDHDTIFSQLENQLNVVAQNTDGLRLTIPMIYLLGVAR